MSDKNIVKYNAYIDKESGSIVCNTMTVNNSVNASNISVETFNANNMTVNVGSIDSNAYCLTINGDSSTGGGTQIRWTNYSLTSPTTWIIGPNYSGGYNGNSGFNDFLFWNNNLGNNLLRLQYDSNILDVYGSVNITDTLNADNVSITGQLNLNDMILADPTNGFQLYSNDNQGYPTINFYSGSPGTGVLQYSMGVYNDIWYVIPNGGSQALQVSSDMSVNIPYSLSICDGNGTFTCDGAATFNATLTANTIVPTATGTGTIGTSSLTYNNSYFNTSNIAHAYIGFIDTLVYMQNGASFYGPINVLNPVTGDAVFTITVNNGNQLNFESTGQTAPLTIDSGSNTLNLPSDLIASGTVSANTINTTIITNPSGTTGTINITGNVSLSTLFATTLNANTIDMNVTLATLTSPLGTGTIYWFQPFQGTAYKKVIAYFVGYENDTTTATILTFTTAFTTLGSITSNTTNGLSTASGGGLSLSNTELSIDPNNTTVYTGIIVIEGF